VITADAALYPEDERRFRVAFVQAFRRRGIVPAGVRSVSEENLLWPTGAEAMAEVDRGDTDARGAEGGPPPRVAGVAGEPLADAASSATGEDAHIPEQARHRRRMQRDLSVLIHQRAPEKATRERAPEPEYDLSVDWDLDIDREQAWRRMRDNGKEFHRWLTEGPGRTWAPALGLTLDPGAPPSVARAPDGRTPSVEVHSVRTALRRGARGALVTELVVAITQRRFGWFDAKRQQKFDGDGRADAAQRAAAGKSDFLFRRGCTVLIDPSTMDVRRVIRTRGDVADDALLEELRAFLTGEDPDPPNAFAGLHRALGDDDEEGFARLHRLVI
jgi:hypothetical protein